MHFQNDLNANIAILEEKQKQLETSLETLEKHEEIDVDEAVTTTAPLYRQYVSHAYLQSLLYCGLTDIY